MRELFSGKRGNSASSTSQTMYALYTQAFPLVSLVAPRHLRLPIFFHPAIRKLRIGEDMPTGRCHTLTGVAEPTPLGCATRGCFLRAFSGRLARTPPIRLP